MLWGLSAKGTKKQGVARREKEAPQRYSDDKQRSDTPKTLEFSTGVESVGALCHEQKNCSEHSRKCLNKENRILCSDCSVKTCNANTPQKEKLDLKSNFWIGKKQAPEQASGEKAIVQTLVFKHRLHKFVISQFFWDPKHSGGTLPKKHFQDHDINMKEGNKPHRKLCNT